MDVKRFSAIRTLNTSEVAKRMKVVLAKSLIVCSLSTTFFILNP